MSAAGLAAHEVRKAMSTLLGRQAPGGGPLLLGVSGGADSLAMAAAMASIAADRDWRPAVLVVDHGLQEGSALVAEQARAACQKLGLSETVVVKVTVEESGQGLEAAARKARHRALQEVAAERRAQGILLAHTMDDQAETVLMRLTRGSGARSLAGMAQVTAMPGRLAPLWRPLIGLSREVVRLSLGHYGITPHEDPHNSDSRFLRVRVRQEVMPVLESVLGDGARLGLVRTAELARMDADALAAMSQNVLELARNSDGLDIAVLRSEPPAISTRVVRMWLLGLGVPGEEIGFNRVMQVARLAVDNSITGPIALPGGFEVVRQSGRLRASRRNDGSS